MEKLYVPLPAWALDALHRMADGEQRTQRQQAAYLIIAALRRIERQVSRHEAERRGR